MPLPPNRLKQRLAKDELALGFGVHHLRTSATGMIAAAADHDWLFIDMEHGAISAHEATQICHRRAADRRHADRAHLRRTRSIEGTRALDNGAIGVVVPHVDTVEQARAVAAPSAIRRSGTAAGAARPPRSASAARAMPRRRPS